MQVPVDPEGAGRDVSDQGDQGRSEVGSHVLQQPCPECGVVAGEPCVRWLWKSPIGNSTCNLDGVHQPRMKLVAQLVARKLLGQVAVEDNPLIGEERYMAWKRGSNFPLGRKR